MAPLRKPDRRKPDQQMTEIKLDAISSPASSHGTSLESPSPLYGSYSDNKSFEQATHYSRPLRSSSQRPHAGYGDQDDYNEKDYSPRPMSPALSEAHHRQISDLRHMPGNASDSTLAAPNYNGLYPSFAPGYQSPYATSEPYTRSSSPYPVPSSSPFRSQETLQPLYPDAPSTFFKRDWVKEGTIAQLHSRDDKEFLSGKRRVLFRFIAPLLCAVSLAAYWGYFIFSEFYVRSLFSSYV
jgi:hypothetical protein